MVTSVKMPQLGESITEGTVIRWLKGIGERVQQDEPLLEISTDKVDAEIPSPAAGVLREVRVDEGETVEVGTVVAILGAVAGADGDPPEAPPVPAAAPGGTSGPVAERAGGNTQSPKPSPAVRNLIREHDIDIAAIVGSGSGGRVTREDVLDYLQQRSVTPPARTERLSVLRQKISEHMVRSRRTSAHVHTVFDVDFTHVSRLRQAKKAHYEQAGVGLTFLPFIARAVTEALRAVPLVNASIDGDHIVYKETINLGIAIALDSGLIVPVVKQADRLSLQELGRAIADLSERSRHKRLTPDDVDGGTFTITNPGTFGSVLGFPIINQPQVAILSVGAIEQRPVVIDDAIVVRSRAYLTLGFDHRLIDGAVADQFMAHVRQTLEHFDANQV